MEAADRLNEYLAGEELPEEQKQAFQITDQSGAVWALRKLKKLVDERKQIADAAGAEIARIRAWADGEEKRLQGEVQYFEALLTDYHRRLLEADPRAKTVKLPHGQLKARAQQPEFIRDDAALLKWLKANRQEFIVMKESPDWAGLKKVTQVAGDKVIDPDSGEVINGVTVVERPIRFFVEVE